MVHLLYLMYNTVCSIWSLCLTFCVSTAITKFGLLCELYTHNKKEMNKSEKQEVLEYIRGRYIGRAMW